MSSFKTEQKAQAAEQEILAHLKQAKLLDHDDISFDIFTYKTDICVTLKISLEDKRRVSDDGIEYVQNNRFTDDFIATYASLASAFFMKYIEADFERFDNFMKEQQENRYERLEDENENYDAVRTHKKALLKLFNKSLIIPKSLHNKFKFYNSGVDNERGIFDIQYATF